MAAPTSAQASSACTTTSAGGTATTTCVYITKVYARQFQGVYHDGLINNTGKSASLTCTANVSKTTAFSVSATVKAEMGLIFDKVSVEVTGGISHSVTSGYSTSVATTVPAHKSLFCDRGIYTYQFAGQLTKATCVNVNCTSSVHNFTGTAPQRAVWQLSVGV